MTAPANSTDDLAQLDQERQTLAASTPTTVGGMDSLRWVQLADNLFGLLGRYHRLAETLRDRLAEAEREAEMWKCHTCGAEKARADQLQCASQEHNAQMRRANAETAEAKRHRASWEASYRQQVETANHWHTEAFKNKERADQLQRGLNLEREAKNDAYALLDSANAKADQLQQTLDNERGVHVAEIMGLQDGSAYRDALARVDQLAAQLTDAADRASRAEADLVLGREEGKLAVELFHNECQLTASLQAELERWRHGVTVEGDFVCPDSLSLTDALAQLSRCTACGDVRANHDGTERYLRGSRCPAFTAPPADATGAQDG